MSVIAKAIPTVKVRSSAYGNQGVERRRQDARDLRSGEARGSALLLAAASGCGHPGRGDRVRRQADEEAPTDDGRRKKARADDSGPSAERKPRSSPPGPRRVGARPRSVYPSDRRSSEVVPATRRVEPSVDPRGLVARLGGVRAVRPATARSRGRRPYPARLAIQPSGCAPRQPPRPRPSLEFGARQAGPPNDRFQRARP